jgi:hypothetical protein
MGSLILAVALALTLTPARAEETPTVKLVDMFAKAEGDQYKIHIMANGDISQYKTTRKMNSDTYKLTLDVPALPPVDSKYDLSTPFSRRFEVWPMMLGNQVYARIAIELDMEVSTVVGLESPSRIFVTISRKSATAVAEAPRAKEKATPAMDDVAPDVTEAPQSADTADVTPTTSPLPEAAVASGHSTSKPPLYDETPDASAASQETEGGDIGGSPMMKQEFFSLFPLPAGGRERPIFDVPVDQLGDDEPTDGIRLGRFLARPILYASWIRGSNLLLLSEENFDDSAILLRFRTTFDLIETENPLRFAYEFRFKDYRKFELDDRFSHILDFDTAWALSPRMSLSLKNHLIRGNTESLEFDPGREVAFNTDPFYRNLAGGAIQMDFSERLGVEFFGNYNIVRFVDGSLQFYDYDQTITGASFLYHMSPLTTMFGKYQRQVIPEPVARPQAATKGDAFLVGARGELGALMTGVVQAGYQKQDFGPNGEFSNFRGFVADVRISRYFSEKTILSFDAGRANNPSNFEANSHYTSNYMNVQFLMPVFRDVRLNARVSLIDNSYPFPSVELGVPREDRNLNLSIGASYYITRHGFFQVDFLHEKRNSNLESYRYRNNVLQFLFGWGFLSQ